MHTDQKWPVAEYSHVHGSTIDALSRYIACHAIIYKMRGKSERPWGERA